MNIKELGAIIRDQGNSDDVVADAMHKFAQSNMSPEELAELNNELVPEALKLRPGVMQKLIDRSQPCCGDGCNTCDE
jgi:hypothetical protein